MESENKLERSEFSSVWKDGGNIKFGMKLDLVKHLLQQREDPQWTSCKQRMLSVLDLSNATGPLVILDVGCGLGIDALAMAEQLGRSSHGGRIVGIDWNSEMLSYAQNSLQDVELPQNVTVEFVKADVTNLDTIADESFDLIRADITLQHIKLDDALKELSRVLKKGGRLATLEGSVGGFWSSDEFVSSTYNRCMPTSPLGGTGIQLYLSVRNYGFSVSHFETSAMVNTGASLLSADPDGVKLKGIAKMLVGKQVLSEEEAEKYTESYLTAAKEDLVLSLGFIMIQISTKN